MNKGKIRGCKKGETQGKVGTQEIPKALHNSKMWVVQLLAS